MSLRPTKWDENPVTDMGFSTVRAGPPRRLQPRHGPGLRRSGPSSSAPQFPVVDSDR